MNVGSFRHFEGVFTVVERMDGNQSLDQQLMEAVKREDIGDIQRLVKQKGADVNCRDSDVYVTYCLREQVVVCAEYLSYLFLRDGDGLSCIWQHTGIAAML